MKQLIKGQRGINASQALNKILISMAMIIILSVFSYSIADIEDLITVRDKVNLSVTGDVNGTNAYFSNYFDNNELVCTASNALCNQTAATGTVFLRNGTDANFNNLSVNFLNWGLDDAYDSETGQREINIDDDDLVFNYDDSNNIVFSDNEAFGNITFTFGDIVFFSDPDTQFAPSIVLTRDDFKQSFVIQRNTINQLTFTYFDTVGFAFSKDVLTFDPIDGVLFLGGTAGLDILPGNDNQDNLGNGSLRYNDLSMGGNLNISGGVLTTESDVYLSSFKVNASTTGDVNATKLYVNETFSNAYKFYDDEGNSHRITLGVINDTSGTDVADEAFVLSHPENHLGGQVLLDLNTPEGMNLWVIKRVNGSASGVANSWVAIPDNDLDDTQKNDRSLIPMIVDRLANYGILSPFDYDSSANRTGIVSLFSLESQHLHIQDDLGQGVTVIEGDFDATMRRKGVDFDVIGAVHIRQNRTEQIGVAIGQQITPVNTDFTDGGSIDPFERIGSFVAGHWLGVSNANCHDDQCARSLAATPAQDFAMATNLSNKNTENCNVSFWVTTTNLDAGDRFRVTINNNTGSGNIDVFNITDGSNVDDVNINFTFPTELFNVTKLTLTFNLSANNPINEFAFVDNVRVACLSTISTLENVTRFDTEIKLGSGSIPTERIFWNDTTKVLELPANITFISAVNGSFINIELNGTTISDWSALISTIGLATHNNIETNMTDIRNSINLNSTLIFSNITQILLNITAINNTLGQKIDRGEVTNFDDSDLITAITNNISLVENSINLNHTDLLSNISLINTTLGLKADRIELNPKLENGTDVSFSGLNSTNGLEVTSGNIRMKVAQEINALGGANLRTVLGIIDKTNVFDILIGHDATNVVQDIIIEPGIAHRVRLNTDNTFGKFNMEGDGTSDGVIAHFKDNSGTGLARIIADTVTGEDSAISFMEAGATRWSIGNDGTSDSLNFHDSGAAFDGTSQMVIVSTGDVDILGELAVGDGATVSAIHEISVEDDDGTASIHIFASDATPTFDAFISLETDSDSWSICNEVDDDNLDFVPGETSCTTANSVMEISTSGDLAIGGTLGDKGQANLGMQIATIDASETCNTACGQLGGSPACFVGLDLSTVKFVPCATTLASGDTCLCTA